MIDEVDRRLKDWIRGVLDVEASLAAPAELGGTAGGIGLYLLDVLSAPPARGPERPPLQISLRYLVTAWHEQPEEAHRMLGELLFAAMEDSELEVELQPLPLQAWDAFQVAPRPSFALRVPLRKVRPERDQKLVRKPLVVSVSPIASLRGVVLGPEGVPLAGAHVDLPILQLSDTTDSRGRFSFPAVPREPSRKKLRVKARGRELLVEAEHPQSSVEPLVIRFEPL